MSPDDVTAAAALLRRLVDMANAGQLDAPSEMVHRLDAAAAALVAVAEAPGSS